MRLIAITLLLLACNGCTVVGCDRAMPGLTWYWSSEAKRCRESRRHEHQEEVRYQQQQQLSKEMSGATK